METRGRNERVQRPHGDRHRPQFVGRLDEAGGRYRCDRWIARLVRGDRQIIHRRAVRVERGCRDLLCLSDGDGRLRGRRGESGRARARTDILLDFDWLRSRRGLVCGDVHGAAPREDGRRPAAELNVSRELFFVSEQRHLELDLHLLRVRRKVDEPLGDLRRAPKQRDEDFVDLEPGRWEITRDLSHRRGVRRRHRNAPVPSAELGRRVGTCRERGSDENRRRDTEQAAAGRPPEHAPNPTEGNDADDAVSNRVAVWPRCQEFISTCARPASVLCCAAATVLRKTACPIRARPSRLRAASSRIRTTP